MHIAQLLTVKEGFYTMKLIITNGERGMPMVLRCGDILSLPSLKKLKIVAGQQGLDRIVRWVYVAEILPDSRDVLGWLQGGELLFVTGAGIKDDTLVLVDLIEKSAAKKLAGMIIFIGPYITKIPKEVLRLADQLSFPLFELPWEVPLVEATRDICSSITTKQVAEESLQSLAESILFSEFESVENLIDRADFYSFDLTKPCCVLIVDIDSFALLLKEKDLKDEKKVMELKSTFHQLVHGLLAKNKRKYLYLLRSDSVILLLNQQGENSETTRKMADQIREVVKQRLEGLTVSIGIGNTYQEIKDLRKSLKEAEQALSMLKATNSKDLTCFYKNLGVYRLLGKIQDRQELEDFCQETIGSLLEYDKVYKANLLVTLETFLRENCNSVRAAQALYIHRNTLKYRLQKIEEISHCSLETEENRFHFQLALKVSKFLSFQ